MQVTMGSLSPRQMQVTTGSLTISDRHETLTAVQAIVEGSNNLKQEVTEKDGIILELEKKITDLEEVQSKIVTGYEQRLKQKEVTIEELQGNTKEHDGKLKAAEEETKQLQLDLNHLRKTAEYDNKMLQEALSAAEANLLSKVEENERLQNHLVQLLSKLRIRSQMTKALSELDNDIEEISNQDYLVVSNSYSKIYQACDAAIDVEQIKESLNRFVVDERDEKEEFSTEGETIEVETPMKKMKELVGVLACGSSLPLSAESE
jgi:DNA repair exonuclease SbcCD ATPase subunit